MTMSNITRSEYYNIKFQNKPFMFWIWFSAILVSFGGFMRLIKKKNFMIKKKLSIILIFFFNNFYLISFFFISLGKNKIYDTKDLIGKDIGAFQLTSWNDNQKINEEFLKKNKFTLINFFASWCAPCRAEHKYLIKLSENSKNLKILGINFKDEKTKAEKWLKDSGNPYYFIAKDSNGKISIKFGIYGIPESIFS